MDSAFEFLKSIPTGIWIAIMGAGGIIIGSIITWVGVCLQLRHDSKERERERQMTLRRDVYLFAAKKIGQMLDYLANFYQTREDTPKGYSEAIQKIQIIGSDVTIVALNQLNDHIVNALLDLIPQKDEINLLEERVNLVTGRVQGTGKNIQEIEKSLEGFKNIFDEKVKLTYDLAGKCQQKNQLAEELCIPVVVAIRKELNTSFDENKYREMMKVSNNRFKENVEKYITSMRDRYQQGMQILLKDANILEPGSGTNGVAK